MDDDRVVDSRAADGGSAIRRRRECGGCDHRYTTFERVEALPLLVLKRAGIAEPFDVEKLADGVRKAAANRSAVSEEAITVLAASVEEAMREKKPEVTSQEIGVAVLDRLRELDEVAYLRFASVYKGFDAASDFAREAASLQKKTDPKVSSGVVGSEGA